MLNFFVGEIDYGDSEVFNAPKLLTYKALELDSNAPNTCSLSESSAVTVATYSTINNDQQQLTGFASPISPSVQGKYRRAEINFL